MKGECRPFVVDGQQVGLIRPDVLKQLYNYPDVFRIDKNEMRDIVELNPAFRDYAERSENVDKVLRQFKKDGTFVTLKGWREEVSISFITHEKCLLRKYDQLTAKCIEVS